MYEFSRALFRRTVMFAEPSEADKDVQRIVLAAAERAVERLFDEPRTAPRVSRTLFREIRFLFPLGRQAELWRIVDGACQVAATDALRRTAERIDAEGVPRQCPSFTRRGTPCQREPLPNGWCPSHQHLVER